MGQTVFSTVAGAALLVGAGAFHGLWTGRWQAPDDESRRSALATLALELGEWRGEDMPQESVGDKPTFALYRRYTHRQSGRWVAVMLAHGRPGHVSVHNPEHCYLGSGYTLADQIAPDGVEAGGGAAKFWAANFQKKRATGVESVRIRWTWTTDGRWQAPDWPRLHFATARHLYKLYLIQPASADGADERAVFQEFAPLLLEEMRQKLFS